VTLDPLILWTVIGLLVLAAFVTLVGLWRLRRLDRLVAACRDWRPLEARVAEIRVDRRDSGMEFHYVPVIAYDYAVGRATYRGEAMTLGPPKAFSFESRAERFARRYAVGASVTAWVDPADPRSAVLQRRAPFRTTLLACLVALWVITLGGIAVLLFAPGVVGPGAALSF